jgi:PDZ domain-containing protein
MKKIPTWLKGLLLFIAVYLFMFQPIPFYMEVPGRAFGLDEMVEVNQEFSDDPGEFYITTVGIQQVTPMTALTSILPYRDLFSEQELFGDQNFEEYDVIQQYNMTSSSNTAIQVAFEAANQPYELEYNGVYVLQVLDESDFSDDLQVGDTVTAVDGQAFQSSHEFIDYVSNLEVGQTIEITYERNGEEHTATGDLIVLESGMPGIGIGLADNTSLETDPPVEIHAGGIGGPSAGLMFSLQIYNQLTEENILGDYHIAGTGTISPDGEVGRIGGIEKKVVAADEEGVDYFLAPDDEIPAEISEIFPDIRPNYDAAAETAEAIDSEMDVIPVKTFADALEFLEQLEGDQASLHFEDSLVKQPLNFNRQVVLF